jgi:hypothetical protein
MRRAWKSAALAGVAVAASVAGLVTMTPARQAGAAPGAKAGLPQSISSVVGVQGCVEEFTTGATSGTVYHGTQCNGSGGQLHWESVSAGKTRTTARYVASTLAGNGELFIAVHGTDDAVYVTHQSDGNGSGSWVGWTSLGSPLGGGLCATCIPSLGITKDLMPEVFIDAPGHGLYSATFQSTGTWSGWTPRDTSTTGTTDTAVWTGSNGLESIATQFGDSISYRAHSSASDWDTNWHALSGPYDYPAAAVNANNTTEMVATAMSNQAIVHRLLTGSSWIAVGNGRTAANNPHVEIGKDACGELEIVVVGTDHALYVNRETSPGSSTYSGWVNIGGTGTGGYISLGHLGNNLLIMVPGTDGNIWTKFQTGCGVWSANWQPLAAVPA